MAGACDSVNKLLSPYADDQLSGSDRAVVEKHLKDCPSCQARLGDLKATSAVLGAFLQAKADAADFSGFTNRVMQQIRKEPLPFAQRLRLKWAELMAYNARVIYAGMGAAVAAGVAVVLIQSNRSPMPDNQLVVHQLTVSDPRYAPVVMHTDDGESVIMLVDQGDDGGSKAPSQNPAAAPTGVTPPPHGGNL